MDNTFKVGDTVIRKVDTWNGMTPGDIAEIIRVSNEYIYFEEYGGVKVGHSWDKFTLVSNCNNWLVIGNSKYLLK
jgi:hypothetical protein